jgi:hypothetical protein
MIYKNELKQMAEINSSLKEVLNDRNILSGSTSHYLNDNKIDHL